MNKSFLKFLADFGPLLIFFTIYYKSGNNLSAAIPPLILATIIAVIIIYLLEKKIPYIPVVGGLVISLFGGLTLYFDNPVFLYMKPTIINLIFAFALFFGKVVLNKNFLKKLFGNSINLEEAGWDKLTVRWVGFFIFLAFTGLSTFSGTSGLELFLALASCSEASSFCSCAALLGDLSPVFCFFFLGRG